MAGNTATFGIYRIRTAVENAVDTLKSEGFRNTDISVLFLQNAGTKDFAHEKNTKDPFAARARAISPLSAEQESMFVERLRTVARATVLGNLVTTLILRAQSVRSRFSHLGCRTPSYGDYLSAIPNVLRLRC